MTLNIPNTIYAGETLKFIQTLDDYLASDGWILTLSISNGLVRYEISSTPDLIKSCWTIEIAPSVTETYLPGSYTVHAKVSKLSEVYILDDTSNISIKQNPFSGTGLDNRTFNQRMVDVIQSAIEKKASDTVQEMTIGTRQLKHYNYSELLKLLEHYKNEVAKESVVNENKSKYSTRFIKLRG